MPFQPVADSVQVCVDGLQDAQLTILDTYWQASGPVDIAGMERLAIDMSGWVSGHLAPLLSRDWQMTRIRVIDLTSPTGLYSEVPGPFVGGVDTEAAPNNVAAVVKISSANRGRSGRGRNFVPGIPNSLVTLNTLDPTFIGDLVSAYNVMVGAGTFSVAWQWCVLSRVSGGVARAAGLMQPVISASMTTRYVKSMRSREVGHGA